MSFFNHDTMTQLGPIYDDVKLPETSEQKEIIELQGNTAYEHVLTLLYIITNFSQVM